MSLQAIKFSDPAYNAGAVSDGWLDTDTGNIIEPGNTNGNQVDQFGWMLAQFQAAQAALDATLAGKIRGECASTGITPESFWEYVGKPLAIMATAVIGGAAISTAGAAAGGTAAASGSALAPTVIAAPTLGATAAAPISLVGAGTSLSAVLPTVGGVGAVGAAGAAGGGVLSTIGSGALSVATSVGENVAKGVVLTGLAKILPSPAQTGQGAVLQRPQDQKVTQKSAGGGIGIAVLIALLGLGVFVFA